MADKVVGIPDAYNAIVIAVSDPSTIRRDGNLAHLILSWGQKNIEVKEKTGKE